MEILTRVINLTMIKKKKTNYAQAQLQGGGGPE